MGYLSPQGGGEKVEELNWIKETITDRKRQILLVDVGFEGYCTQQSVSWTGEWQCKGMTSIPLPWLTTLHKLFDLSQSYQHPWDLWEFLPIIQMTIVDFSPQGILWRNEYIKPETY